MLQDVLKKSSEGTATPATSEHAAGGVARLGAARLVVISPLVQSLRDEFAPVVALDSMRHHAAQTP